MELESSPPVFNIWNPNHLAALAQKEPEPPGVRVTPGEDIMPREVLRAEESRFLLPKAISVTQNVPAVAGLAPAPSRPWPADTHSPCPDPLPSLPRLGSANPSTTAALHVLLGPWFGKEGSWHTWPAAQAEATLAGLLNVLNEFSRGSCAHQPEDVASMLRFVCRDLDGNGRPCVYIANVPAWDTTAAPGHDPNDPQSRESQNQLRAADIAIFVTARNNESHFSGTIVNQVSGTVFWHDSRWEDASAESRFLEDMRSLSAYYLAHGADQELVDVLSCRSFVVPGVQYTKPAFSGLCLAEWVHSVIRVRMLPTSDVPAIIRRWATWIRAEFGVEGQLQLPSEPTGPPPGAAFSVDIPCIPFAERAKYGVVDDDCDSLSAQVANIEVPRPRPDFNLMPSAMSAKWSTNTPAESVSFLVNEYGRIHRRNRFATRGSPQRLTMKESTLEKFVEYWIDPYDKVASEASPWASYLLPFTDPQFRGHEREGRARSYTDGR